MKHSQSQTPLILMDGADLMPVLERQIDLDEVLLRKRRHAVETGIAVYRRSVATVQESFARLEAAADAKMWRGDDLFELSEGETANSVAVLNALVVEEPTEGPDEEQLLDAARTPQGAASRRARVVHCLERRGSFDESLAAFIEVDLDNVVTLFKDFNDGTHGHADRFDLNRRDAPALVPGRLVR